MSAPSIPNLLSSLRGSRGEARGRGRGRGRGGHSSSSSSSSPSSAAISQDTVIQGTDTDAAVSRMSAVDMGYLDDPFAQFFVQQPHHHQQPHQHGPGGGVPRRLPIINRGTYARTTALDRLIDSFLAGGGERQIVSLGAGTDTRCFRLFSRPGGGPAGLVYHEIDFPAVAAKKLRLVRAAPPLAAVLPEAATLPGDEEEGKEQGDEHEQTWGQKLPNGSEYWCHGRDLRDLARPGAKPPARLRTDLPTLLVSECCLCYLEVEQAQAVVAHFADRIPAGGGGGGGGDDGDGRGLGVVLYEPMRPDDPFGRQMVANLAARRIHMPTLDAYGDAGLQRARLRDAGFDRARALSVEDVWRAWVPAHEKDRVDALEGLDEVEEWSLLAAHYVVAWAWRGRGFEGWEDGEG